MNKTREVRCPKCGSDKVKLVDYVGARCIVCSNCGYDETTVYDVYPSQKTSQKQKGRFTPYKVGGGKRVKN